MDSDSFDRSLKELQDFNLRERGYDSGREDDSSPDFNFRMKDVWHLLWGWFLLSGSTSYTKYIFDTSEFTIAEDIYTKSLVIALCGYVFMYFRKVSPFEIQRELRTKIFLLILCSMIAFTLFLISLKFVSHLTSMSVILVYFTIYEFSSCILLRRNCKITMILIIPAFLGLAILSNLYLVAFNNMKIIDLIKDQRFIGTMSAFASCFFISLTRTITMKVKH